MKRRASLFRRLTDVRELERAWVGVLAHYTKGAVPEQLRAFDRFRAREIARLAEQLHTGQFLPHPASLIFIAKTNEPEESRPITLMRPEDRIVLKSLLSPLFERSFLPFSFAYRDGKAAWAAIERVTQYLREGFVCVAAGDIDDFFCNLNRETLLRDMKRVIFEKPIADLIETYLYMGAARNFELIDSGKGISQGSPLSPLLSNIALTTFDRYLHGIEVKWVRYADNFIVLDSDSARVRDAFEQAEAFLLDTSGLKLNPQSRVLAAEKDGFDFLGFRFKQGTRTISPNKLEQKRQRVASIVGKNISLKKVVRELSETVEGWRAYYGRTPDTRSQLSTLEQHIADTLQPWLERFRSRPPGGQMAAAELKAVLLDITLPVLNDASRKLKWIELLLARSRPGRPHEAHGLSPAARQAIEKRKQEYRKLKQEREEVLIAKPGTYLGRTGERLLIRYEGKREAEIPFTLLRNITLLTTAVSVSGELMAQAASRGINIVVAGADGRPLVRIGLAEAADHELSLLQSSLASGIGGLELAREIVAGKIRNQANLLRYFLKYPARRGAGDFLITGVSAVKEMEAIRHSLLKRRFECDHDLERNRLFAAEGNAASCYWSAVRVLLWWKPGFEGRTHRGATDLVNALLNYGYGILYSRLMNVLVRAGLNVYVGFLHKPRRGKAGLLYDFIEEFRGAAVDRTVFSLLNLGIDVRVTSDGLDEDTRRLLARRVVERLQTNTRYHGESIPLNRVMELQAQLLVRQLREEERYRTFVLSW